MSWFSSSDQPDSQPDPEAELRSLELFTPTGADRARALSVLRRFTEASTAGRSEEAQAVLDAVEPDSTAGPTMPQVLGVSIGLLETWFSDRTHRSALAPVRAASKRRPVRACATDLLAAARQHTAYASIDDLSIRHGGLAVFEAAATLVAASVAAIAKRQRLSVPRACRELLIADADYTGAELAAHDRDIGYSGFTPADDRMVQAFRTWLSEQDSIAGPGADEEVEVLQSMLALTRVAGIDLHNPNDIEAVLGVVADMGADDGTPADATTALLLTLDDYVHFQWERTRSPEAWELAHDAVEAELGGSDEEQVVTDAIDATRDVDPEIRRRTLLATRAVTAVRDILDWLGDGRPITGSGNLRLADIEPVAAMLGIRAEGVRRTPETPRSSLEDADLGEPPVHYARSQSEIPVLYAWWRTLGASGIIEITASRAHPGPQAAAWLAGEGPPLETLEQFAALLVAIQLSHGMDRRTVSDWRITRLRAVKPAGMALVAATDGLEMPDPQDPDDRLDMPAVLGRLAWLQKLGLLERRTSGEFRAPEGARAAVASGAMVVLANAEEEEFEESRWDEDLDEGWSEGLDD
ncbi:hypothetical protein [Acidipropionibacterium virtanenii]|uniref:Uncharacterized protein n=1 Tax=Acidipropionibacterium virtanenii TaxID=2057246 RepID=A0A344UXZ0_9ACTN|nr:hypothetical protein [Acidipropionibacterium virtanenii]AXE40138.1 hypothetical protein JS278_03004 [Acidipropionibacterium virtanenii]